MIAFDLIAFDLPNPFNKTQNTLETLQ